MVKGGRERERGGREAYPFFIMKFLFIYLYM